MTNGYERSSKPRSSLFRQLGGEGGRRRLEDAEVEVADVLHRLLHRLGGLGRLGGRFGGAGRGEEGDEEGGGGSHRRAALIAEPGPGKEGLREGAARQRPGYTAAVTRAGKSRVRSRPGTGCPSGRWRSPPACTARSSRRGPRPRSRRTWTTRRWAGPCGGGRSEALRDPKLGIFLALARAAIRAPSRGRLRRPCGFRPGTIWRPSPRGGRRLLGAIWLVSAVESSPCAVESSPCAVESSPGAVESSPCAVESSPGAVESSPGAVESSPGAVESSPGAVESSPGAVESSPVLSKALQVLSKALQVLSKAFEMLSETGKV